MLLAHSDAVSESASHKNGLHEKISCEKLSDPTEKHTQNDLRSEKGKRTAFGFISSSTSHTDDIFKIDRQKSRLKRMKCGTLTTVRLHDEEVQKLKYRTYCIMITLTYAKVDGWHPDHISKFMNTVRTWCKRSKIDPRYAWVAELQKRGAVHYHVVMWLPKAFRLPMPDKRGWWKHGSTKIETVRKSVAYLAKYLSKDDTDSFPKGCRIHGHGGLSESSRNERCWWLMPTWVREITSIDDKPRRAKGGGIVLKSSGEILESPWKVLITNLGVYITRA
ncbi:rolling circle replication-associated protein [Alteromonas flava]|uniref:rolling circle replication-associated protein n=1 Tax=Alteromonas flava TaxID=2048003 RepID=UPI000C291EC3|nr:hypothetical protein [Alteromonas flava]